MKLIYVLIVCFLYILCASSVFAEYYHYIDKNGIKHYTDDISEIPEDQRPNLNIYQSIQTSPEKEYNKLATQLNIEIEHFRKKKESYDTLVEQYNKQINSSPQ